MTFDPHEPRILASGSTTSVAACPACGHVTLSLGNLSVRLGHAAFDDLVATVRLAARHLDAARAAAAVPAEHLS